MKDHQKTSSKSFSTFEIIYQDEFFVAINKPPGIHVHPTYLSKGEKSCMQILRDQLRQWVYTVHRLDRATSGVLLFALDKDTAQKTIQLFSERKIKKRYLAVVRGYLPENDRIDYPLKEEPQKAAAEAITEFQRLSTVELPFAMGKFPTVRYSLAAVTPITGRKNQIRKHFAHISHPIIGDVRYGDGKHNRLFREQFGMQRLLLMAVSLEFPHPVSGETIAIKSQLPEDAKSLFKKFSWEFFAKDFENNTNKENA